MKVFFRAIQAVHANNECVQYIRHGTGRYKPVCIARNPQKSCQIRCRQAIVLQPSALVYIYPNKE